MVNTKHTNSDFGLDDGLPSPVDNVELNSSPLIPLCSPEVLLQLELLPPGQPRLQLASPGRRATVNIVGTVVSIEMKSVPVCFGWMNEDYIELDGRCTTYFNSHHCNFSLRHEWLF